MYQLTNAHNKIQLKTISKFLHVSAPGGQPQGAFGIQGIQAEDTNAN